MVMQLHSLLIFINFQLKLSIRGQASRYICDLLKRYNFRRSRRSSRNVLYEGTFNLKTYGDY